MKNLEKKTCWFFELIDLDNCGYITANKDYIDKRKVVFNSIHYVIYIHKGDYEGLLYLNEDIEEDSPYSNLPYPVYLTWDGWDEYTNDYYQNIPIYSQALFREQAFVSKEEMWDYIDVQLPKIFKHIEDNNF